jgi:hypothetical protein
VPGPAASILVVAPSPRQVATLLSGTTIRHCPLRRLTPIAANPPGGARWRSQALPVNPEASWGVAGERAAVMNDPGFAGLGADVRWRPGGNLSMCGRRFVA